jgi:hypothetical protein
VNDFRPVRWLPGPHLETIVPYLWPARRSRGWAARVVRVAESAAVRVEHLPPSRGARGTLLLLHGMGGCAASRYMWRTSAEARRRGWLPVRMNARNAGGTEALSRTLYNAGQSDDVGAVLADLESAGFPRPFAAAGFSLGGNTVLRYAATAGVECRADAVAGVSPPIDLDLTCRSLELPGNRLYQAHFTRQLCRQLARIRRLRPVPGPALPARQVRTIRRFDALYVAPDAGHPTPEAYYAHASAGPRLGGLRVPALILSAANDPFVPESMYAPLRRAAPPGLRLRLAARGGHLGYWGRGAPRFWAAAAVLDFLDEALGHGASS